MARRSDAPCPDPRLTRWDATPFLPERKSLKALREADLTNVVKHFKFEERGKRRIHQKPGKREVDACLPWLRAELDVVRPTALLLLGATAAKALLGQQFRLTESRGRPIASDLAELVVATIHPSAILRARDDASRRAQREAFTEDLRLVAERSG